MFDKTIYLDNAASTPLRPEVLTIMLPHLQKSYGNPSSIHRKGREAHALLESARNSVAHTLNVQPSEIIFTSGGTEANNLGLLGVARSLRERGVHILLSSIEHPSILNAGEVLSQEGFNVEYLPVDVYGSISIADTLAHIRPDTILISVMLANNEIGTIQPIETLARILRARARSSPLPLLHTDACQAMGQIPVYPHILGVDLMTLNSSKIYGPKGVGMLYVREGVSINPFMVGGHQESGKRAGTENLPNIIGFAKALELAMEEQPKQNALLTTLRDTFLSMLREKLPQMTLNGHPIERLPNNVHISLPFIEGESLVLLLDTYGICAATGSACNAYNLLPSHVLRAIGQSSDVIHGSLRFTFGRSTTQKDLEHTTAALATCVKRLQTISPLPLYT